MLTGKLDSTGTVQNLYTHAGTNMEGKYVVQTNDGGYLTCAKEASGTHGDWDVILMKFDSAGLAVSAWVLGTSNRDECYGMEKLPDGSISVLVYVGTATNARIVTLSPTL